MPETKINIPLDVICQWLKDNVTNYILTDHKFAKDTYVKTYEGFDFDSFIEDFKTVMKANKCKIINNNISNNNGIQNGKWYVCIKEWEDYMHNNINVGDLLKGIDKDIIVTDDGREIYVPNNKAWEYFCPATEPETPNNKGNS